MSWRLWGCNSNCSMFHMYVPLGTFFHSLEALLQARPEGSRCLPYFNRLYSFRKLGQILNMTVPFHSHHFGGVADSHYKW